MPHISCITFNSNWLSAIGACTNKCYNWLDFVGSNWKVRGYCAYVKLSNTTNINDTSSFFVVTRYLSVIKRTSSNHIVSQWSSLPSPPEFIENEFKLKKAQHPLRLCLGRLDCESRPERLFCQRHQSLRSPQVAANLVDNVADNDEFKLSLQQSTGWPLSNAHSFHFMWCDDW